MDLETLTGSIASREIIVPSGRVSIRFESDGSVARQGFNILVRPYVPETTIGVSTSTTTTAEVSPTTTVTSTTTTNNGRLI